MQPANVQVCQGRPNVELLSAAVLHLDLSYNKFCLGLQGSIHSKTTWNKMDALDLNCLSAK